MIDGGLGLFKEVPLTLDGGQVAAGDQEASLMTMTGQFIGSLPWSSPEQAEGKPGKIEVVGMHRSQIQESATHV